MNASSYESIQDKFETIQQDMNQLSKPRYQEVQLLSYYKGCVVDQSFAIGARICE